MKHDTLPHVMIAVKKIKPHPDNPRKDLGDLEELADSIRKNGIMQNLTIIPENEEDEENDTYIALIGHRRLAAAREAGLYEVPCSIVYGLSHREQVGIMLEENMQRSDLTPIEQAFGFQMMLDLGETEESIAEKTGFSRSTIHHRLQIAKLDKRILKETEDFQLSISDLMALEQIKSIARRNAVLNISKSSEELRSKAAIEARSEQRYEREKKLIPMLEALGIKRLPENLQSKIWTVELDKVKAFSMDDDIPEDIGLEENKKEEPLYWYPQYGEITIYRKVKRAKATATEYELKEKKRKEDRGALKEIMKKMIDERDTHVKAMLNGTAQRISSTPENWEVLYETVFNAGAYFGNSADAIRHFMTNKHDWQFSQEEREEWKKKIDGMESIEKFLACTEEGLRERFPFKGFGMLECDEEKAAEIKRWHEFLGKFGFTVTDPDAIKVLDGSHELYEREETKWAARKTQKGP